MNTKDDNDKSKETSRPGGPGARSGAGDRTARAARRRTGTPAGRSPVSPERGVGAFLRNNMIFVGTGIGVIALIIVAMAFIRPRTANAGFPFPCLTSESTALHVHPYLKVTIDDQPVVIPDEVGITSCFEPMHTHDQTGIIHIEGPEPNFEYTLADFIEIWRVTYRTASVGGKTFPVEYTPTSFLGHPVDANHEVQVWVDGQIAAEGGKIILSHLDYCNATMTAPPCFPTAASNPYPPNIADKYGSEHTVEIKYVTKGG